MSAHVVVIDSTARRHVVKTTPNKYLSEVVEEVSAKLGINASQYGLKHNNKPVDLSRTLRLSGLSSGAKLELIQLSKSAGVVSIALQLPESEAKGQPNARLTDKFPSSTTLWLVLRKFEAGVAGGGSSTRNFTARGVPSSQGAAGAGRLYYEQPVLNCLNRELSSFTDLQKTLAQLGLNSGSALIRLSFRHTDMPLEEAMAQIQGYFDTVDPPSTSHQPTPKVEPVNEPVAPSSQQPEQPEWTEDIKPNETTSPEQEPGPSTSASEATATTTTSSGRPVSVFRPPSSTTPSAALISHNDTDYVPTVEHAQIHQKMLNDSTRNRRLPTEAELQAQATEEAAKWAQITEVEIKVRFPDQSAVSAKFKQTDTGHDLYGFVRDCLEDKWRSDVFHLRNPGVKGKNETIPDDANKTLIRGLQLKGRVLVTFTWDDSKASLEARGTKALLKPELRAKAQEFKAPEVIASQDTPDDPGVKVTLGSKTTSEDSGDTKKKLPKWLKGLAKK
ncbi:hypothetical protein PV10_02235 [Exophiala mesophila]|uniref:UBX domain-containing protein n=1 Tax=Exophiala mesophila TaxID=212818 RepID=A0A0D1ZKQ1_EXOME|nr:uncharacterized protein PV10_02235 [Exophiala mesophila]KIV94469.1 hypothetical protein PV10_02235 [Exophiala mesophila]